MHSLNYSILNIYIVINVIVCLPVSVLSAELTNSVEEEDDEDDDGAPSSEDDITTHGLERLSSAATCLVAGVEYTHGQQIYRHDPCEFCLCLDGEMFCWWQDCPPTMEGPCRDRGPFSPCISVPSNPKAIFSSTLEINTKMSSVSSSSTTQTTSRETSSSQLTENVDSNNLTDSSFATGQTDAGFSSETPLLDTTKEPKRCTVMGKEYQIGDKLPHDTGNCLECICGQGAKVTCSPYQCAPAGDEINDYRPPGLRQPVPDIF